jgi:hypothetical protein
MTQQLLVVNKLKKSYTKLPKYKIEFIYLLINKFINLFDISKYIQNY